MSFFPTWEEIGDVVGGVVEGASDIWEQSSAGKEMERLEQAGREPVKTEEQAKTPPLPATTESAGGTSMLILLGVGIWLYIMLSGK